MPRLDSARQRGPEITLRGILIIVESGGTGGRINAAEIFHSQKLGADFACTSTTGSPMDKRMPQVDSAHQIGAETILQGVLIVVESDGRGGRIHAAGIFHSQKLGPILPVPQQPAVPWTNGCYRRIQCFKLV